MVELLPQKSRDIHQDGQTIEHYFREEMGRRNKHEKIQLEQVLRNKRFVLFTIILPIGWYIFFDQLQKGFHKYFIKHCRVIRVIISLATFSKRIASDIRFILLNPILQAIVSRTI